MRKGLLNKPAAQARAFVSPLLALRACESISLPLVPVNPAVHCLPAHGDDVDLAVAVEVLGAQVLDRDATTWVDVPPVPGAFVVNIGDLMARWTNDRYRSTVHRVVPPDGRDRFSVVLFMDLDHHATIEVLPTCVPAGEQPRYGPTTAGEHLLAKFRESMPAFDGA